MGNCCGGEDAASNVNINPGNKRAGAPKTGNANTGNAGVESGSTNIKDYTNDKVREILNSLGDYKKGSAPQDAARGKLEERPLSHLDNNAKYQG